VNLIFGCMMPSFEPKQIYVTHFRKKHKMRWCASRRKVSRWL